MRCAALRMLVEVRYGAAQIYTYSYVATNEILKYYLPSTVVSTITKAVLLGALICVLTSREVSAFA